MKKIILFLLPIFVISCKKETAASTSKDSVVQTEFSEPSKKGDSANIKISDSLDKDNKVTTNSIQNKDKLEEIFQVLSEPFEVFRKMDREILKDE